MICSCNFKFHIRNKIFLKFHPKVESISKFNGVMLPEQEKRESDVCVFNGAIQYMLGPLLPVECVLDGA